MAFIFVPNADGSFTEGDKQTNPDTGVEYIYIDGAWRALGPKIENEFDTLDDRYVRLNATSVVGNLYRLRGPNAAGTGLSSFQNISDGEHRLYNIALAEDSNTGWAASVQYVQNYVGTQIDAIPDVNLDGYATEDYVDNAIGNIDLSAYLPLAGGTMTGKLILDRPGNGDGFTINGQDSAGDDLKLLTVYHNSSGNDDAINYYGRTDNDSNIANLGWVKTWTDSYLLKTGGTMTGTLTSDATTNQRINFLTNGSSANCDISRNGTWQFSIQDGKTKVATQIDMTNHKIINVTSPTSAKDAANKEYVDNKSSSIDGGHFYVSSGSLYFEFD